MLAITAASVPLAAGASAQLSSGGWLDKNSESAQVSKRLETEFGGGQSAFLALFRADASGADARSADFQAAIATTLAGFSTDSRVGTITGYAQTHDDRFVSIAGDATYVVIGLNMTDDESIAAVDDIQNLLSPPAGYDVSLTGFGPIQRDSAALSEKDLL
ncbi:MAG: MMPL family transporter, partial [Chloroflexota bacterium]